MRLEVPHPLGIRPLGDAYLAPGGLNAAVAVRNAGLGRLNVLPDEIILSHILPFLSLVDTSLLGSVSKPWYAFSTTDDMYRTATLSTFGSDWIFTGSWRETYARRKMRNRKGDGDHHYNNNNNNNNDDGTTASFQQSSSSASSSSSSSTELPSFKPIPCIGLYSDVLFRAWAVSRASIRPQWLRYDSIPRLDGSSSSSSSIGSSKNGGDEKEDKDEDDDGLSGVAGTNYHTITTTTPSTSSSSSSSSSSSYERFVREFEEPNIPVILTNIVDKWEAMKTWNPSALVSRYGQVPFHAAGFDFSLHAYFNYMQSAQGMDDQPLVLFDKKFGEKTDMPSEYTIPPHFAQDLFSLLEGYCDEDEEEEVHVEVASTTTTTTTSASSASSASSNWRPDYRWLIIGPKRSGSVFHQDPNGTSAFNALLYGTKKWILFPPHMTPPGVFPSDDGGSVASPMSIMEWFIDFYKHVAKEREQACRRHAGTANSNTTTTTRSSSTIGGGHGNIDSAAANDGGAEANKDCETVDSNTKRPRREDSLHDAKISTATNSETATTTHTKSDVSKGGPSAPTSTTPQRQQQQIHQHQHVPMEGTVKAGEVIFVPRGWWHCVLNVEDTIAVTQNFVSPAGLPFVLMFLKHQPGNISGVKSEKAPFLYEKFVRVLRKKQPELLKNALAQVEAMEKNKTATGASVIDEGGKEEEEAAGDKKEMKEKHHHTSTTTKPTKKRWSDVLEEKNTKTVTTPACLPLPNHGYNTSETNGLMKSKGGGGGGGGGGSFMLSSLWGGGEGVEG